MTAGMIESQHFFKNLSEDGIQQESAPEHFLKGAAECLSEENPVLKQISFTGSREFFRQQAVIIRVYC